MVLQAMRSVSEQVLKDIDSRTRDDFAGNTSRLRAVCERHCYQEWNTRGFRRQYVVFESQFVKDIAIQSRTRDDFAGNT